MRAEYFMSLNDDGEIVLITEATPPHELDDTQVSLTPEEFRLLKAFKGNLGKAHKIVHAIEKKRRQWTLKTSN